MIESENIQNKTEYRGHLLDSLSTLFIHTKINDQKIYNEL